MRYASRISRLEDKSLLNAMELAAADDVISFAAGFPSSETYPLEEIKESFARVLDKEGKSALSYCSTSGYRPLRQLVKERMEQKFGLHYEIDEIIITSGSQQGVDMSAMLFVDKDDAVFFESPSYLGAVSALRAHEAELVPVPTDEEGMELGRLKTALDRYGKRAKMIYVNPDFQNPTGRSWSSARREAFMELISEYEIPVLEDAAYAELSFGGGLKKPLSFFDRKGQTVYIGTFSKIFCPGLRVAWLCARKELMEKYLLLKNAADLSSSAVCQMQMAQYLSNYNLDGHIERISALYQHRRDVMVDMIEKEFPKEVRYTVPEGGLFLWIELPEGKDSRELFRRAAREKVTFIPGGSFYPGAVKNNEFRLNFSNMNDRDTVRGLKILGRLTGEYVAE